MRAHVGGRHVGVSARVPGPSSAMRGLEGVAESGVFLVTIAVYLLIAVWAVVKLALRIVVALLLIVTAPIWGPIRGWVRHRRKAADRKAVARVRDRNLKVA